MNKLGIGLYSLAGVYGKKDIKKIQHMLRQAVEAGIKYFDVADQYGPAEEVLGETLKNYRQEMIISTKVGLTTDGGRDCSKKYLKKACEQSLKKLQTDYLDIYQIHFDDPETPVEETLEALEELKITGKIKEYSIGHLPVGRVLEYINKGNPAYLMIELSPVSFHQYNKLSSICAKNRIKIITMSSTGRGLITGKIKPRHRFEAGDIRRIDPLFQRGLFQSALKVVRRLEDLAAKYGNTPVQIGLNWVLNQPAVSFVLTGPSSVAHLAENLGSSTVKISARDFIALNSFLLDEEKSREKIIEDDINEILASKLSNEKTEIIAELVYLLSGLVETGKTSEKEILPLFKQLMVWRKDSHDLTVIQGIKRELNQLYRLSKKEGKR